MDELWANLCFFKRKLHLFIICLQTLFVYCGIILCKYYIYIIGAFYAFCGCMVLARYNYAVEYFVNLTISALPN